MDCKYEARPEDSTMPKGYSPSYAYCITHNCRADNGKCEKARVAELEAIVHAKSTMLDRIAEAAGFKTGDTYSAESIIARLKGQQSRPSRQR